jgi:hypothetical protein
MNNRNQKRRHPTILWGSLIFDFDEPAPKCEAGNLPKLWHRVNCGYRRQ